MGEEEVLEKQGCVYVRGLLWNGSRNDRKGGRLVGESNGVMKEPRIFWGHFGRGFPAEVC